MTAGVLSCTLLCWDGGVVCEIGYSDIFSLFFGTSCSREQEVPKNKEKMSEGQ